MALVRPVTGQGSLVPTLGLFSTTMLIVGSMIGSGIFRLPASMMAKVQNPGLLVLVWVVGGLLTICGALTFAQLARTFPRAGGQYVFLRESLGKRWAFLYGWTFFWVVQTGIIAAVAVIFAQFLQRIWGFGNEWIPVLAVLCIVSLTVVNYFGARFGGAVQNVFTVAKFAALVALVALGFALGNPTHATFGGSPVGAPTGGLLFVAFVLAMLQGFFAFDGWPQAAYVAPEVKDAARTVPRAMVLGVLTVTAVYVLATFVYVYLLSVPQILAVDGSGGRLVIAAEAAKAFSSETGAKLISAAVVVSTFGTVNAYILTSPRIYYAIAQDGLFWAPFRRIHPRWNTPDKALLFQGIWAGLLVTLGTLAEDAYTAIVEAVVFGIWLFYAPTVWGYFRLRRQTGTHVPDKTPLYPWVPIVFGASALVVVGTLLAKNTHDLITGTDWFTGARLTRSGYAGLSGIWGSLLVATGLPILLYWWRRERQGSPTPTSAEHAGSGKPARS